MSIDKRSKGDALFGFLGTTLCYTRRHVVSRSMLERKEEDAYRIPGQEAGGHERYSYQVAGTST